MKENECMLRHEEEIEFEFIEKIREGVSVIRAMEGDIISCVQDRVDRY